MKSSRIWIVIGLFSLGVTAAKAGDAVSRLGLGANYWTAIDDIDVDNVDEEGFSYFVSYQYRPGLLGLELDVEMLPDRFGEDAYAPAAYVILGGAIYAAAGIGIVNQDSEWADDPFYALRAGLDLELLPSIYLDLSASYRFDSETKIKDAVDEIDTDTLFLGAALRFGI